MTVIISDGMIDDASNPSSSGLLGCFGSFKSSDGTGLVSIVVGIGVVSRENNKVSYKLIINSLRNGIKTFQNST